ncbi:MAG: phosphoribosylglycinamide formyltransferase [Clostridia bacterium]
MSSKPKNIVILVSGGGTNLQAIIDNVESGYIPANISLVVSSRKDAYALERATKHNIDNVVFSPKNYSNPEEYSRKLIDLLDKYNPDLIVLAGFMTVLSDGFIEKYENKIMNTHPSLLPSFGGKGFYGHHVHKAVLNYGVKVSGATIMFVTEEIDAGPIILQESVKVYDTDTIDSLQKRVLKVEHKLYPKAIKLFVEDKLIIDGRIVRVRE